MNLSRSEIWLEGDVLRGVIYAALPNKSNSREIGRVAVSARARRAGGRRFRPILRKGRKALAFEDLFRQIVRRSKLIDARFDGATNAEQLARGCKVLHLKVHVHGNFVRDVDCELLPDLLQKAGLINNDRAVRAKTYRWTYRASRPRFEFELGYLEEGS